MLSFRKDTHPVEALLLLNFLTTLLTQLSELKLPRHFLKEVQAQVVAAVEEDLFNNSLITLSKSSLPRELPLLRSKLQSMQTNPTQQ